MGVFLFLILAVIAVVVLGGVLKLAAGLIVALVLWMLAGMFAGRLLRGRGYGPTMDILLGLVGGLVGSFVFRLIGASWVGNIWLFGNLIVGIIGAVILVYTIRFLGNQNFAR